MKESNLLYQHYCACFRLYRDFINLQTKFSFPCSLKPFGWSMYFSIQVLHEEKQFSHLTTNNVSQMQHT